MQKKHWITLAAEGTIFLTLFFGLLFAINLLLQSLNQKSRMVRITLFIPLFFILVITGNAQNQLSQAKTERLYQKGSELIAHSNYGAARKVFSEFLQEAPLTDPRRGEAEYYVAFSALSLSHTDGEKLIDDFIASNPSSPKASTAFYDLANFFYDEKNYSKSSQYFKKVDFPALTSDQQNQAHFKWGYSYFNLKRLNEALEQFNFVKTSSNEYSPAANYYAGFVEYSNGLYDEALVDLKKAETNASYATVVPYLIANVYYKQKKYDDLLQYTTSIKDKAGLQNADEISMLAAEAYYFKGDYKNAVDAYEKFLNDNPSKAEGPLLFRAGYSNYALNQTDRAITYLSKAAATKDSTSFYSSYYLGILYLKQGQKPLALNAFDYARRIRKTGSLPRNQHFNSAKSPTTQGNKIRRLPSLKNF